MPKELIHSRYGQASGNDEPRLSIGWARDLEHVEVGTVMPEGAELHATPEGNGWFIQLDRDGINRAIRTLRRARDQAFGRDE
jgi:hypothetical protein